MSHGYEKMDRFADRIGVSRDADFFRREIRMLPEGWEKIVASDGRYFEQKTLYSFFTIKPQFLQKQRELIDTPNTFSVIVSGGEQEKPSRNKIPGTSRRNFLLTMSIFNRV